MIKKRSLLAAVTLALILSGCQSASEHAADVRKARNDGDKLTLGRVQKEIRVGMTNAEVAEVLGSPNMVTTDDKRRENWVYDRISTQTVQSSSSGGVNVLILGAGSSTGARSTSQRTLTIIVKFDDKSRVRDFAYRSSSF